MIGGMSQMVPCFRTIWHDTAEEYLQNTADEEKDPYHIITIINQDHFGMTMHELEAALALWCGAQNRVSMWGNPAEIMKSRVRTKAGVQLLQNPTVVAEFCCLFWSMPSTCSECVEIFDTCMCKMSQKLGSLDDEQALPEAFSGFIQNDGCNASSRWKFVERCHSRVWGALCG